MTINTSRNIHIFTDSQYSIDAVTKWYPNWLSKNTFDKKNIDLISEIYNIKKKETFLVSSRIFSY